MPLGYKAFYSVHHVAYTLSNAKWSVRKPFCCEFNHSKCIYFSPQPCHFPASKEKPLSFPEINHILKKFLIQKTLLFAEDLLCKFCTKSFFGAHICLEFCSSCALPVFVYVATEQQWTQLKENPGTQ